MAPGSGIEPAFVGSKATVLPLDDPGIGIYYISLYIETVSYDALVSAHRSSIYIAAPRIHCTRNCFSFRRLLAALLHRVLFGNQRCNH